MEFLITDQRVGDIAERQLDDLPISNQFLPMLRLSQFQIPAQRSTRENGLCDLGTVRPDSTLRTHKTGEKSAPAKSTPTGTRQRNLGEKRGLSDPDFGVRGDQVLLDLANVRPSFEQRGRHARRHFRRKRLLS